VIRMLAAFVFVSALALAQEETRSAADMVRDGTFTLTRGDCSFAQYFFQEALRLEPENTEAMIGKGRALVCQRVYELGIAEFQRVLELEPNNVAARVQLAKAYQEQYGSDPQRFAGRLSEALAVLQQAEQLAPNDPEVFNTKGVVLYLQGDMEAARSALERAVSQAGSSSLSVQDQALIHVNLGRTYRELGNLQQALQSFRRAVSLNPASATAHNNVGDIYFRLGDCEMAIYELTQATTLNPALLDAASNLAIALFECGQVQASVAQFERALDIPGSLNLPPLFTYLSRAYVQQGRYDEAVRRAQQGALLPPSSAEAYYYLGQAYGARQGPGDVNNAREAYQKALEIDPNYRPAQDALSRLGS
jgi:tetratricopeptide (TPR) repeat protein